MLHATFNLVMSGRRVACVYLWPLLGLEIAKVSAAIHCGITSCLAGFHICHVVLSGFTLLYPNTSMWTYAGPLSKTWIEHLHRIHTVGSIHRRLTQGAPTGAICRHSHSMCTVACTSWAQAAGSIRRAPAAVCRAGSLAAPPPGVYTRLHHRRWRHAEMSSFVLALIIVRTQSPRCLHSPSLPHIGSCVPAALFLSSALLLSFLVFGLFSYLFSFSLPRLFCLLLFHLPGCSVFFHLSLLPSIRFWYIFFSSFLTFIFFRLSDSRLLAFPSFTAIFFHT